MSGPGRLFTGGLSRTPEAALAFRDTLGLEAQVVVHAEARAALGGKVAIQGEPDVSEAPVANGLLVRDIDGQNFGGDRVAAQVASVEGSAFASTAPGRRSPRFPDANLLAAWHPPGHAAGGG